MNVVSFSLLAIRKVGVCRFIAIASLKIYRKLTEERTDRRLQNVYEVTSPTFTGVLPLALSTPARFKKEFPSAFSSLLAAAQKIRGRQFEFLGHSYTFDEKINWHLDPVTKREWQKKVYQEGTLYYDGSPADVKHVWELNRHQYFTTLAQAFYLSGDRTYLDELVAQWLDWIEENPYRVGIHWASPLEIGVRLTSWTVAFQFIEHHLSRKDRGNILRSIWQQASFLSSHLSVDKIVRTNHLIGESAGLFITASSFTFPESKGWEAKAREILEREITSQVFDDGVAKEQSSSYHRFDVDFLLIAHRKAKNLQHLFSEQFNERLARMIRCLDLLHTPDHRMPVFGDCDNGRGVLLTPTLDFWDARGLIAAGAVLLPDKQLFRSQQANEEAFWLLSESEWNGAKNIVKASPSQACTILEDSGYIIIQNNLSAVSDYCFVRAGPFGMGGDGFSSHSHNDLFSPILYLGGKLILTDSGTSIYTGNDAERDYLRSAAAHNTTYASAWDFFCMKPWFGWSKAVNGAILKKEQHTEEIRIECGYEGSSGIPYKRSLVYQPTDHRFHIEELFTKNINNLHSYFHLNAGAAVHVSANEIQIEQEGLPIALLTFSKNLRLNIEQGWISRTYGKKESAVTLHFRWDAIAQRPVVFTFEGIQK